jgi:hypothetical protein
MKVVVAAVREDCPTALALRKEGVAFELVLMEHEYSYSDMFTRLWDKGYGDSFISLEHDIIPWPGALQHLWQCRDYWCAHKYPLAPNAMQAALGCIKVSRNLIFKYPLLCKLWNNREWNTLDGIVCPAIQAVAGKAHIHTPPFAHVKP